MNKIKLINHNDYYDINGTVIRGTITMSSTDYKKTLDYLKKVYLKALKDCDTYKRDSLSFMQHYTGKIYETPKSIISLGICATKLIVGRYKLKNYKDINYGIKITK